MCSAHDRRVAQDVHSSIFRAWRQVVSLLEILAGISYYPVPGMKRFFFLPMRRVTKILTVYPFVLNLIVTVIVIRDTNPMNGVRRKIEPSDFPAGCICRSTVTHRSIDPLRTNHASAVRRDGLVRDEGIQAYMYITAVVAAH